MFNDPLRLSVTIVKSARGRDREFFDGVRFGMDCVSPMSVQFDTWKHKETGIQRTVAILVVKSSLAGETYGEDSARSIRSRADLTFGSKEASDRLKFTR